LNIVERRVAFLEGKVDEQGQAMTGVREAVTSLEGRVVALEARMDRRFERLEQALDQRFAVIDNRFLGTDARLDRISNQLFGLIIAVAVAAVGGILGIVTALFR